MAKQACGARDELAVTNIRYPPADIGVLGPGSSVYEKGASFIPVNNRNIRKSNINSDNLISQFG